MDDQPTPLSESLAALSQFFVGDGTVRETLDRMADLVRQAVPPVDEVGITMMVDGRATTTIFTDPEIEKVDQAQYESGEGPCLDAYHDGSVHRIESTREPGRWQAFREVALEHGFFSTLSLPMVVNHEGVGALNLYSRTERGFGEGDQRVAEQFAVQAALVAANALAYWDAHQLAMDLNEAMRSRAIIEQAKGIVMSTNRCGSDEAFEVLVRASQRENVKLRDIAERMTSRHGPIGDGHDPEDR